MKRSDNSFLHKGNRLFQQFITDQYGKSELQRLRYIESNQKKLRADLYKGVEDSITNTSIEDSGRTVILPSTFTGSDRWYQKNYQNSMALVRKFGKPDLFITMTMDPKCEEVTKEPEPGQTPYDRPDILCRVFDIKLKKFLK